MSKKSKVLMYWRLSVVILLLIVLAYYIATNAQKSWNIILALMGFSAVVFIHECGHFFVAKAADIKVEAFSIFIPPLLVGVRKTEQGFRFRILPALFPKDDDPEGDGLLSFTLGRPGRAGETEYRIGLVPVAGYVKMLGQEDASADKQSSDPRSFGNKSTGVRMAVIAAGVTFNVIAAVVVMTGLYLVGIPLKAPVVGGVIPGSPAALAELQVGDRIIEIGKKHEHVEFGDILIMAALSNKGEAVPLTVQRRTGEIERMSIAAEQVEEVPVRLLGIYPPYSLNIAQVTDPQMLLERTGLQPDDRIVAVNGQPIEHYWQLQEAVMNSSRATASLQVERTTDSGVETVDAQIPLLLNNGAGDPESEAQLNHICSVVPRLRITSISPNKSTTLQAQDIIVAIADVNNPTYKEMRDITTAYADKDLPMEVMRTDAQGKTQRVQAMAHPTRSSDSDRVLIGVAVALDAQNPIVAKTISTEEQAEALAIPRGALITQVGQTPIGNYFEMIKAIKDAQGQTVPISWQQARQSGTVQLAVVDADHQVNIQPSLAEAIPLADLEEIHKADGLGEALVMSTTKCKSFILQTYVTLKQLISRSVSLKAMSGPVGIATVTYQAVEQSYVSFLYLLAFISANLAVVNFLPIPVVDGGVFVLLIIEKIKGGPLSIKVQEVITYAGLALIVSVFVYLTYNDIVRLIFG
jgi:regulator of sigma E protease